MDMKEQIVLTPKEKKTNSTTLWIERKFVENVSAAENVYVGGGDHQGIIVNKESREEDNEISKSQLSLEFIVYLVSHQTGVHTREKRTLRFWFKPDWALNTEAEEATVALEFFRDLVHPKEFPRDYVGFIKKIMKLLQNGFKGIVRIELILCQLGTTELFVHPSFTDDSNLEKIVDLTEEKVLEEIEFHYPNPITIHDLSSEYNWEKNEVEKILNKLLNKKIIKCMDYGAYTRVTQGDADVKIVKQMPKTVKGYQPTIAIITAQYAEKLAIDAMIESRETFVRYTTVGSENGNTRTRFGESNVYTLGNIGEHRVVCTKLPALGHTREAMTAAGNTTTRLLGTFQHVEHVILVGVGGGVPHFTNYNKHVRLGDVVISHASPKSESIYVHCEEAEEILPSSFKFNVKEYCPKNSKLQNIGAQIKVQSEIDDVEYIWKYLDDGLIALKVEAEHYFFRPDPDTDKLYMAIGEEDMIEVAHPLPLNCDSKRIENRPRLHLGVVGAGREIAHSDHLRQKFSQNYHVLTYVSEFDPVIQSIIGNCRDSFLFVRGICDYKDGTKKNEWQAYAALAAASVAKAIINAVRPNFN